MVTAGSTPAFHTFVSTWTRYPGITKPSSGREHPAAEPQCRGPGVRVRGPVPLDRPPARVAQRLERLARKDAGHLMLAVTVARRSGEHRDDDRGTEPPHHVEHILEQRI